MKIKPDDITQLSGAELQKLLTELKAYQLQLEQHNQELNSKLAWHEDLFDSFPIGCVVLDEAGVVHRINNPALTLLGYNKQDILGLAFTDYIHSDDKATYAQFLDNLTKTLTLPASTLQLNTNDGKNCVVEYCGISSEIDGKRLAYLALTEVDQQKDKEKMLAEQIKQLEISLRKKTDHLAKSNKILKETIVELNHSKHQLHEREAKFNAILNASIEGIIVIDTAGRIVSANAAVENIFGYSSEELIGYSVNELMPIAMRKKRAYHLEKYLSIFIPKAIGHIRELEGMRKDGSLVPLDMTIAEFPLDGVHYYSGIVRDVSARKYQELQAKEHLEKLAHVTRLGLMGEMASGIAHEVNQPLSAVVNYSQVCLAFLQKENPDLEKISETMKKANQQALKAGQIIHSMREFVKPRKIHRSTADINDLIYDAIELFESDFKQHLIAMRFELTKNLPNVFIDRVQIEQVIVNLIRNAADALKDLPQFTQRQLSIETSLNELNYIVVRVKDNGPGLTDLQKEKILTPFFTTKSSGMGMGLSISRSLVEAHQGALHFNSKEDKGTTFYFTLPTENSANGRNNN